MLVFIDESGIHKKIDHSAFVLVYVAIKDNNQLEKVVQETEQMLGIEVFHWSQTVWQVKKRFIETILKEEFTVKAAVVKNPVHPEKELERLLPYLLTEKNIKTVFIDGFKPKWYVSKVKKILRDKGILVKKLKMVNDRHYAGIRIADMSAGLIRSYFDNPNNAQIALYYKKLAKKIVFKIQ